VKPNGDKLGWKTKSEEKLVLSLDVLIPVRGVKIRGDMTLAVELIAVMHPWTIPLIAN
jgi:hypothetical protein